VEESTFMLEIETEKIWECDNFLSLFITYIAAVYAFNLVYPKKMKKVCYFSKSSDVFGRWRCLFRQETLWL